MESWGADHFAKSYKEGEEDPSIKRRGENKEGLGPKRKINSVKEETTIEQTSFCGWN